MKKTKKVTGGRVVKPGPRQSEMLSGRDENVSKKAAFKDGPVARTDVNAGRVTPLIPSHQVEVPPKGKAKGPTTL